MRVGFGKVDRIDWFIEEEGTMERRRRYKPPRHPKTGFKTYLLIFLLYGGSARFSLRGAR